MDLLNSFWIFLNKQISLRVLHFLKLTQYTDLIVLLFLCSHIIPPGS
jgi:hypothetical protein